MLTQSQYSQYQVLQDAALQAVPPYPQERYAGRGIVICAGGARLFTCAWVLLRVLREIVGCRLPIEVWHLGPEEMDTRMAAMLKSLDAETVDARRVSGVSTPSSGWALKPFAILHSRFREVILIDADNVPVQDPAQLFETPEYAATGALFWPDVDRITRDSPIWEICRVEYRPEPAFESGQLVIDKARCWTALALAMHLNEHSEFYYRLLHGDKDTFHMAWRRIGQPYSMAPALRLIRPGGQPPLGEGWGPVLAQHDFKGELLFQHRNFPKLILFGQNPRYPEFRHEKECFGYLDELAGTWDGRVAGVDLSIPEPGIPQARWFRYLRLSSDERPLEFLPDGRIGRGGSRHERRWRTLRRGGFRVIEIMGLGVVTCQLERHSDGVWRGAWQHHERMPVELSPLPAVQPGSRMWRWLEE